MVKLLLEFSYFGRDYDAAVALPWIVGVVILMVLLRHEKLANRLYFCHDRLVPDVGGVKFIDEGYGRFLCPSL